MSLWAGGERGEGERRRVVSGKGEEMKGGGEEAASSRACVPPARCFPSSGSIDRTVKGACEALT